MAKQKILVTGANGQLGKELQQLVVHYPQYDFVFRSKEELPIERVASVQAAFKTHRPNFCINCAAYTAVDKAESEQELAFLINGIAPGILAKASKEYGCRFIHISTDYVFDGSASTPYTENAPVNPQSVYGASKLQGEETTMRENPDAIIIRTSWVYSAFGKNFVKTMAKLMGEKKEINVVNDQFGSPTYAADLAHAILQIIGTLTTNDYRPAYRPGRLSTSPIFHFSNHGIISWYEFAVAIKELTGSTCKINPIITAHYPTAAKRPAYSVLDKTKIQHIFGIQLKDWKERLAICLEAIVV